MKRLLALLFAMLILLTALPSYAEEIEPNESEILVEDGIALTDEIIVEYGEVYYSKDEVALYLYAFGELPPNYIKKNAAMDLGWDSRLGNLWDVAPGACIGGDSFGNRESRLPKARGRRYFECDVNYEGGYRASERLIFSNDGLIYYTADHYETFTLLYDGWYDADTWYEDAA